MRRKGETGPACHTEAGNEKYYLRMWLLRIGMGTRASHESRMALLKDLNGWSAFRTEEEAMAHARKQKERRHQNL